MFWTVISTLFASLIVYVTFKAWDVNQHFKRKGIPHLKPVLFFGNLLDVILKRRTLAEVLKSVYDAFPDEPVIGYYHTLSPQWMIRSPEMIERVFVRDFSHFTDHGAPIDLSHNVLSVNLFSMTGSIWRAVRAKMSPIYTASKLRLMTPKMVEISERFVEGIGNKVKTDVDVRTRAQQFILDVTGNCAFGLNVNTLQGEDEHFADVALSSLSPSLSGLFRTLFSFSFPNLSRYLKITFLPQRSEKYFTKLLRSVLKTRVESNSSRNDLIQLLVELKKKGTLNVDKYETSDEHLKQGQAAQDKFELTDDLLIGQAFSFLVIGLETASLAALMACVDIAANPECQEIAREEIRRAVGDEGIVTFDVLKDLDYLDRCVKETLRLHCPVDILPRQCVKTYTIPGTSIVIEKGDQLVFSIAGVNMDPRLHDEPLSYIPDRWLPERSPPGMSFISFGEGPRICIGMRFALLEIKCFISKILLHYKIRLHPSVKLPIKMNPHSFLSTPQESPPFIFEKLES